LTDIFLPQVGQITTYIKLELSQHSQRLSPNFETVAGFEENSDFVEVVPIAF